MSYFVVAFLLSFLTTMWLVHSHHLHSHISHDHDLNAPQNSMKVPYHGLVVSVFQWAWLGFYFGSTTDHPQASLLTTLLICALPAFLREF